MIKDFLIKKETIFIILIAIISVFFVVLGFLFLFFKSDYISKPREIPSSKDLIEWDTFSSKVLKQNLVYPNYMYVAEQNDEFNKTLTLSEFESNNKLNFFSNQNHIAFYPDGISEQFFYNKTKQSDFKSSTGQEYIKTEYLTFDDKIWAISFRPKNSFENWQAQGLIWIQSQIQNREILCVSSTGIVADVENCDPYQGQKIVYKGIMTGNFLEIGYEIINKNKFK